MQVKKHQKPKIGQKAAKHQLQLAARKWQTEPIKTLIIIKTQNKAYYMKISRLWLSPTCHFLVCTDFVLKFNDEKCFFVEIKDAGEGLPKTAASIKEEKMTCEQVSNQLHSTLPTEIMVNIEQRDQPVAPCLIRFVKQMNKSSRNKLPLGGWVGEDAINKRWPNLTGMFDNQYRRSI